MDVEHRRRMEPSKIRRREHKPRRPKIQTVYHSCLECPKEFLKFSQLVSHRKAVHGHRSSAIIKAAAGHGFRPLFRCFACKTLFASKDQLAGHMAGCRKRANPAHPPTIHGGGGGGGQFASGVRRVILRSCHLCSFRSGDEKEFLRHIRNEHTRFNGTGGPLTPHGQANGNFKRAQAIVVPILKTKSLGARPKEGRDDPGVIECRQCGGQAERTEGGGGHVRFENKEDHLRHCHQFHTVYYCPFCHVPVEGSFGLDRHLLNSHSSIEEDFGLGSVIVIQDGETSSPEPSEPPRSLLIPPASRETHDKHAENVLSLNDRYSKEVIPKTVNPKKYKTLNRCDECKYMTYHGQNLVRHMNSFHTPHACPICRQICKGKKRVMLHLRDVHNEDGKAYFPVTSSLSKAKSTLIPKIVEPATNTNTVASEDPETTNSEDDGVSDQILDFLNSTIANNQRSVSIEPDILTDANQSIGYQRDDSVNMDFIMRQAFEKVMAVGETSAATVSEMVLTAKCSLLPVNENLAIWEH